MGRLLVDEVGLNLDDVGLHISWNAGAPDPLSCDTCIRRQQPCKIDLAIARSIDDRAHFKCDIYGPTGSCPAGSCNCHSSRWCVAAKAQENSNKLGGSLSLPDAPFHRECAHCLQKNSTARCVSVVQGYTFCSLPHFHHQICPRHTIDCQALAKRLQKL
jgi:hypothetical protein